MHTPQPFTTPTDRVGSRWDHLGRAGLLCTPPVSVLSTLVLHAIVGPNSDVSERIAAGVTLVAFILSLSTHVTFMLLASLVSFLAALLTLIAFAIDIALYAFVKHQFGKLTGVNEHTSTAPGAQVSVVYIDAY